MSDTPGNSNAPADTDRWFAVMYDELRQLAARELRRGHPVGPSPTTLVHELYSKLANRDSLEFPDRPRFMGYAARAMRGLIIDMAREQGALKRGAGLDITHLTTGQPELDLTDAALTRLSESIDELATVEPELAAIVDLKFFCGFTFDEIARIRGLSERTAQRHWEKARLILFREVADSR
jgi:RNA polymerase sigma factor (TIGR02999 family)